jgi:hypothetical protein
MVSVPCCASWAIDFHLHELIILVYVSRLFPCQKVEFDSSFKNNGWGVNITQVIKEQLYPRKMRSFAASSEDLPSIQEHVQVSKTQVQQLN